MITKQDLSIDSDGDKVTLKNTFDIGTAKRLANEVTASGGERNDSFYCMGYIPPEMWQYDPWLIAASKAQYLGDTQEHAYMLKKFFEVHPALSVKNRQKYYSGVSL